MKRVMTYVIAAVFAWCLFVFLPARAMNTAVAFSDGASITTTNAESVPVSTDVETLQFADGDPEGDCAPREVGADEFRKTPEANALQDVFSAVLPSTEQTRCLNACQRTPDKLLFAKADEDPENRASAALHTFDLPPNLSWRIRIFTPRIDLEL